MKYFIFATKLLYNTHLKLNGLYVKTSLPFFNATNNLIVDLDYILRLFSSPIITTLSGNST